MRFSCLLTVIVSSSSLVSGFVSLSKHGVQIIHDGSMMALEMVKKMRNKQADLAKKLAAAKEQNLKQGEYKVDRPRAETRLSDRDLKELNDRRRFEDMLVLAFRRVFVWYVPYVHTKIHWIRTWYVYIQSIGR